MSTSISDAGLQFADGNLMGSAPSIPTTGTYTAGQVILNSTSILGEISGWKRVTTGSSHVLGTDWVIFGSFGIGQINQDVTASRAFGTTYTNTTGKPRYVNVFGQSTSGSDSIKMTINGVIWYSPPTINTANSQTSGFFMVANGATYVANFVIGTGTLQHWIELG
jgi:hypothetical protein